MKIKHVEELVGITSKNIRFYEEQGLINPNRAQNGYREYGQEDIERLKQIKLLRKIGVSIEEINQLFLGKKKLEDVLDHNMDVLDRQKDNLTKMQTISSQIIESHVVLTKLDVDKYLDQIEVLEKEGASFMLEGCKEVHKKKSMGAIIAAGFMVMTVVIPIIILLWVYTVDKSMPLWLLLLFIAILLMIGTGIIIALFSRIKEIEGGEEDEASKY